MVDTSSMANATKKNVPTDVYSESDILSRHRNRTDKKCSIKEFTNKRREMLMLNMSINTRQEEIDKLHAEIENRERRLKEKEAGLKESMRSFDCFLKELDQQARQAARLLDEQLTAKRSKELAVKELSQQTHIVSSGIRQKLDEIGRCDQCKQLLMSLTPKQWFDDFRSAKRDRQKERRMGRIQKKKEAYLRQRQETKDNERHGAGRPSRRRRRRRPEEPAEQDEDRVPDFEDEPLTSSDEECPIYFRDGEQLLGAFSDLDEANSKLGQEVQAKQLALGELRMQSKTAEDG